MKYKTLQFTFVFFICSLFVQAQKSETLIQYVNPFIGTGGHGHTFPGATVPFGMVQLSPDTRLTGWDGCSGYHYTDSLVYGFSHTHLSGTGVSDYGDILLMPYTGKTYTNNGANEEPGYRSAFKKENEIAEAAYYKTKLDKYDILAELTATERAGFHKYTFKENDIKKIFIDLEHRDMVLDAYLRQVNEYELEGYRHSKAWAENQKVFFVIKFNQPIRNSEFYIDNKLIKTQQAKGENIKSAFSFEAGEKPLMVQVAISAVDIKGARKNLDAELTHWDFNKIKKESQAKWEKALSKIIIKNSNKDKKTIFYTALYHTMIAPNLYMDADGRYRGTDDEIHQSDDHTHYTIFSLWDTYRATHPLYTLIEQERTNDFIKTFIHQYEQGGKLPMWELANNYTGCMIGYHAVPVISDAYIKNIRGYDAEKALESMISSAMANRLGIDDYRKHGFLPGEAEAECVSKTLEYAYDDWTIAQMAMAMEKKEVAATFYERAQYYKNVYDPTTGFMRARLNNRWFFPFDPSEVNYNYTEANSWQYSFYVPQDVEGWIKMMGGNDRLEEKLDGLFSASSETSGRDQVDITGLIGQYAHGNEPSHHIAYLYNYIGKTHKTQKYVRQIMEELYSNQPDGLSGNEDCGQMSAWLVMSALGFYPVAPGSPDYVIGSPWFDSATIQLENGKSFRINAENNSRKNIYVKQVRYNKIDYKKSYISHFDIIKGGDLTFEMTSDSKTNFGKKISNWPKSRIETKEIVAVPAVVRGERAFLGSTEIELTCATKDATILYKINNGATKTYSGPFKILENAELITWATKEGTIQSKEAVSNFFLMPENRSLKLKTEYASHYAAGGDNALIDMLRGGRDYRTGTWQGYYGHGIEAIVDLGEKTNINEIGIGFLQDENSWIFMPTEIEFFISKNGKKFQSLGKVTTEISPKEKGAILKDYKIQTKKKAKYIKIIAKNRGVCPPYHKGAGGKCWIFADEIFVN